MVVIDTKKHRVDRVDRVDTEMETRGLDGVDFDTMGDDG